MLLAQNSPQPKPTHHHGRQRSLGQNLLQDTRRPENSPQSNRAKSQSSFAAGSSRQGGRSPIEQETKGSPNKLLRARVRAAEGGQKIGLILGRHRRRLVFNRAAAFLLHRAKRASRYKAQRSQILGF